MSIVNETDVRLFNYCMDMLMGYFCSAKDLQQKVAETNLQLRFRVPIKIIYLKKGKKLYIPTRKGEYRISCRELECLQCSLDGLTAKETAQKLFISARTVETYLSNLKERFEVRNKSEMIKIIFFS